MMMLALVCVLLAICCCFQGSSEASVQNSESTSDMDDIHQELEKIEEEMAQLKVQHQLEIEQLKYQHSHTIHQLNGQREKELSDLKTYLEKETSDLKSYLESENSELRNENHQLVNLVNAQVEGEGEIKPYHSGKKGNNVTISFTAYATSEYTYDAGTTVLFEGIVANYGELFNKDTGIFVCPQAGYYLFSVHIMAGVYSSVIYASIQLNGVPLVGIASYDELNEDYYAYDQSSNIVVIQCNFASQVWVQNEYDGASIQGGEARTTTFSGTLLFPL